jgi:hypothetical protein
MMARSVSDSSGRRQWRYRHLAHDPLRTSRRFRPGARVVDESLAELAVGKPEMKALFSPTTATTGHTRDVIAQFAGRR